MIKKFNFIKSIMLSKNRQIKAMREMAAAQESMNIILSAYIALLAEKKGQVVIPKKTVSEALGKYRVTARADNDNYIIVVSENGDKGGSSEI